MGERINALSHKTLGRLGIFLILFSFGMDGIIEGNLIMTLLQGLMIIIGVALLIRAMDKKKLEKEQRAKAKAILKKK